MSCSDCQCSRKRVKWGTITQSELKILDNSSGNQLSGETDVSRLVLEPTHAVSGMPKDTSVLIINDTSEDWRQGKGDLNQTARHRCTSKRSQTTHSK